MTTFSQPLDFVRGPSLANRFTQLLGPTRAPMASTVLRLLRQSAGTAPAASSVKASSQPLR